MLKVIFVSISPESTINRSTPIFTISLSTMYLSAAIRDATANNMVSTVFLSVIGPSFIISVVS